MNYAKRIKQFKKVTSILKIFTMKKLKISGGWLVLAFFVGVIALMILIKIIFLS